MSTKKTLAIFVEEKKLSLDSLNKLDVQELLKSEEPEVSGGMVLTQRVSDFYHDHEGLIKSLGILGIGLAIGLAGGWGLKALFSKPGANYVPESHERVLPEGATKADHINGACIPNHKQKLQALLDQTGGIAHKVDKLIEVNEELNTLLLEERTRTLNLIEQNSDLKTIMFKEQERRRNVEDELTSLKKENERVNYIFEEDTREQP